jgi:hypothetical protein
MPQASAVILLALGNLDCLVQHRLSVARDAAALQTFVSLG